MQLIIRDLIYRSPLDYIRDIFDDNAVIITGAVTQRVTGDVEMNRYRI